MLAKRARSDGARSAKFAAKTLFLLVLLVTLSVTVAIGLVQRAPLGRSAASFVTYALLPLLVTALPRAGGAVALEVTVGLAPAALVGARCSSCRRCSKSRNLRFRRLPPLLVDLIVGGKSREHAIVEGIAQLVAFLHDEVDLRREGMKQQIRVGSIGKFLPRVLETEPKVGGDKIRRVFARFHFEGVEPLLQRAPSFLGATVEASLQSLPSRRSISHRPGSAIARVGSHSNVR